MTTEINPQAEIPGTGRPKLPSVEEAADLYEKNCSARMKAKKKEDDSANDLQKVLRKNEAKLVDRDEDGNPGYVYEDRNGKKKIAVLLHSKERVKVKAFSEPKPEKPEKVGK